MYAKLYSTFCIDLGAIYRDSPYKSTLHLNSIKVEGVSKIYREKGEDGRIRQQHKTDGLIFQPDLPYKPFLDRWDGLQNLCKKKNMSSALYEFVHCPQQYFIHTVFLIYTAISSSGSTPTCVQSTCWWAYNRREWKVWEGSRGRDCFVLLPTGRRKTLCTSTAVRQATENKTINAF